MKTAYIFVGLLTLFLTLPISIFQTYLLLTHVNATPLMWFLFLFNLPIIILIQVLGEIAKHVTKKGGDK